MPRSSCDLCPRRYGRRIRACLQQPELAPVSVPAQITVLLALTEKLFDGVPLERMKDAQHAVHEAAEKIPAEIRARFETAAKLSDEDRQSIIEIAQRTLTPFQSKAAAKREEKTAPESKSSGGAEVGALASVGKGGKEKS